jgi:hypothetical protein
VSPTNKWAAWRALPAAHRLLLVRALVTLPLTALGLRVLGVRRMLAFAERAASADRNVADERDVVRATSRLVAAAARHGPYRASCLPVALALKRLLARRGIATELRIGVASAGGELDAHAWLEYRGQPLIDGPDVHGRFHSFDAALTSGSPVTR